MLALIASAAFFAAIHFAPVEFPGLFAFGIVLGLCFQRTGRIGMPIAAHIGFNAMGLRDRCHVTRFRRSRWNNLAVA